MDAKLKVSRAVTKLAFEVPFFGSCALSVGTLATDQIPTAATDGKTILYNEEFVNSLSEAETVGLICHEVMHIIWQHCQQFKDKDPKLCNVAMDYIINDTLSYEMNMDLPAEGILDFNRRFKNMTWQQVYRILEDINKKQKEDNQGKGEGFESEGGAANDAGIPKDEQKEIGKMLSQTAPDHLKPANLSDAELEELKQDIERITIKAAQDAENMNKPGSIPGAIRNLINEIRESKVAWEDFIFTTMQAKFPDDFTYRRPNKKYLDQGMYMPTMESTRVKKLAFAFDTSGSVSYDELITFFSECNFLIDRFRPESVLIMTADYVVAEVIELDEGESIEDGFTFVGGGGTCFRPVFKYIEENNLDIDQLIYFSDMYVNRNNFPETPPDYDVIWVSTGNNYNVPFGELVMAV
jgi:predicted metal-dependent peptidase